MMLNCGFRTFGVLPPPTRQLRIISFTASRMFSDDRIQGRFWHKETLAVHVIRECFKLQMRRTCFRCSVGGGRDNGDISKQQNDFLHKKSRKNAESSVNSTLVFTKNVAVKGLKVIISVIIVLSLTVVVAPTVLSSRLGRRSALGLINLFIPGHIDVQSLSLGWTKPARAEGISLKGTDEKEVLLIRKLETRASLWSLMRGKSGLGDCTINHLMVNLMEEEKSGNLRLALALIPARKLSSSTKRTKSSTQAALTRPSSVDIALAVTAKAQGGGLKVIDGKLTVRDDVATTLGQKVFVDILLGPFALENDDNLRKEYENHQNLLPVKASLWSEGTQAETMGFIHPRKQFVQLIQPLKLEMDLSPAVAQLYLARINPLLGEVVGPTVQDEDMPDVVVYVSPQDLMLPADNFAVTVEPMKAVLARGPLAGGILNLLSSGKEDVAKGQQEVSLQTSRIVSQAKVDGSVECSRIDFLIAGKIEVATWGAMNWKDETLGMIIGIPSSTISSFLGIQLSSGYFLKIPVAGTLERPQVDWRAAAVGVAQLSLRRQGGKFFKNLISLLDSKDTVPESTHEIPWSQKRVYS